MACEDVDPLAWLFSDAQYSSVVAELATYPKCRSKFTAALKRAAVAVDEAKERAQEDPLRESEFERAKDRFLSVFEAMSAEQRKNLRYHALFTNMQYLWEDEKRSQRAWDKTRGISRQPTTSASNAASYEDARS